MTATLLLAGGHREEVVVTADEYVVLRDSLVRNDTGAGRQRVFRTKRPLAARLYLTPDSIIGIIGR